MKTKTVEIFGDFVSLFFPNSCAACDAALVKGEQMICTRCIIDIPRSNYHLERENPFYRKLVGRIPVEYVVSFLRFSKRGRVQRLLHELKYRNKPELGRRLGYVFGSELYQAGYMDQFDLIVSVPLHPTKKKIRGYNQSEEFATGLGLAMNVQSSDTHLKRTTITTTQTRKNRLLRWQNVRDVFQLSSAADVSGKRVLLVDDVVTTGATLEAAGRVLLDGGCRTLSIACIAATQ